MKLKIDTYHLKIILVLTLVLLVFLNCLRSVKTTDETIHNHSITGIWEGLEPGSDNYKIVFKILQKDSLKYTGTGYGFQDGYYTEHYHLDSVSFNPAENQIYIYNKLHDFTYQGKVNYKRQFIAGKIASAGVNGRMKMKYIEEKALKGLYPRGSTENEVVNYEYKQPEQMDDGWEISTLDEEGVNSQLIDTAVQKIIDQEFVNMTSLLIVKNNKLVCEEYFYGHDPSALNRLASRSKSVTSLLFGIAVDNGEIKGVDESVMDYFPKYSHLKTDANSKILTKHLLTMSAGFEWNEFKFPYGHPQNILAQNDRSDDYLEHIFKRPMIDPPGETFNYNCASTMLLGWMIKNASGLHADKYAEQYLFNHLGIKKYHWYKRDDGFPIVHGGLFLTARDIAKIGSLVLNQGRWKDKQIVSETWIEESTRQYMPQKGERPGYGYQWWTMYYPMGDKSLYTIAAMGADPQMLIIIPAFNAMIVTNGSFTFVEKSKAPLRMIVEYIVPALM